MLREGEGHKGTKMEAKSIAGWRNSKCKGLEINGNALMTQVISYPTQQDQQVS